MMVYRIAAAKYATELFASGRPARWNDKNQFVLYAGGSRSLSALELLVRRASIKRKIPYKIMSIELQASDKQIQKIDVNDLEFNWRTTGAYETLRQIGSKWYEAKNHLILQVPSAVIPEEYNYVINTYHPEFKEKVRLFDINDFLWDSRLVK